MRVLFVTGRETAYMRNTVLLRAFRRFATVDLITPERHDRSIVRHSLAGIGRAVRHARRRHDLVFVGFYGYLLMQTVGRIARAPVLFDAFISNYDTLCFDRQLVAPGSVAGRILWGLDRNSVRLAAHTLLDTPLHMDYFVSSFGVDPNRLSAVPVGVSEELFFPRQAGARASGMTELLYYCTYLPLHGADVVVRAAEQLRNRPIHFRLIGDGPQRRQVEEMARAAALTNLSFEASVGVEALADAITGADICLGGHFGSSEKAGRVVPGKLYQMLAMQRATIAADSPAHAALLTHGETALLVPAADPLRLAEAISLLAAQPDLRQKIAEGGYALYRNRLSEARITEQLYGIVARILDHPTERAAGS